MSADLWMLMGVIAINAVMFHALPRLSRPDILFSVTVPADFAASGAAAEVIRRYRTVVWLAALVVAGVTIAAPYRALFPAFFGMYMVAILGAWASANRRVRPHAAIVPAVRVAALAPRDSRLPGGALFAAGPLLILAAAALFVWSQAGSASGTYGGLAVSAGVVSAMLAMAWGIVARTRQVAVDGAAAAGERTFKGVSVLRLLCSAYAAAVLGAAFAVVPVIRGTEQLPPAIFVVLGIAVALSTGLLAVLLWLGQGGQRGVPLAARAGVHGDATPDAAWKGGFIYYNPHDPALLVEKRMGIGWTLNMGNRWSWLIVGAAVSAFLISSLWP